MIISAKFHRYANDSDMQEKRGQLILICLAILSLHANIADVDKPSLFRSVMFLE